MKADKASAEIVTPVEKRAEEDEMDDDCPLRDAVFERCLAGLT